MKETPKDSLSRALRKLSEYQPPKSAWEQISASLERAEASSGLRKALSRLPVYPAPDRIWGKVQRRLPFVPVWRSYSRWAAVIGGLLLVVGATWMIFRPAPSQIIRSESEKALNKNLELQEIRKIYTSDTLQGVNDSLSEIVVDTTVHK